MEIEEVGPEDSPEFNKLMAITELRSRARKLEAENARLRGKVTNLIQAGEQVVNQSCCPAPEQNALDYYLVESRLVSKLEDAVRKARERGTDGQ
jgi:hypothetical protein